MAILSGDGTEPVDVLDKVASIVPLVRQQRSAAEAAGRLGDEVVAALVEAGVTRLFLPSSLGGLEVDPVLCAKVTEMLARADTAAAWFVMVANSARLMAAYWPAELVEILWADNPDAIVAASGNRPLTGEAEKRGYRVSGFNSFVSGCHHAQWFLTPLIVGTERRMALLRMRDCEIVDNWQVLGMRGSGSNDVRVHDVWIPARQTVLMTEEPGERNRYYQGALYRCPGRVVFATYVPVTLVLAEQALATLLDLAEQKSPYATDEKLKHRSIAQVKYGKALAIHRSGRDYFYNALAQAWQRAQAGEEATPRQKADLYLAGTHAVQSSAEVVGLVADAAGTSVIYEGQPLERIVRDMETLRHHGFASESRYGSVAQLYWGAKLDYPLMLR
ncbi:MAG: acyl-CoA dehydrogenase family protein [Gammaproteobacteria bacterium]|nr:acyl-CoA dehydrogenase family protein [Gammaproteobacteria bacterium]